ncbi:MAG: phosphatase PAP2 family protein [Dehalococcoidia bacterium]|nr:MAG: phosphatase PAP2 family protein [Dehalococcoidia bacterium]
MASLRRGSEYFMIALADVVARRNPLAQARTQLAADDALARRLWSRWSDAAFIAGWLGCLAALIGLAAWCSRRFLLPFDMRPTLWVQHLDRFPLIGGVFDIVNKGGSYDAVAAVLLGTFALLLISGLRFEALVMAGAGALHYVQLGMRAVVHRPFDGAHPPWVAYPQYDLRQWPGPDGFPSGHMFGEFLVYGLLFAYVPRLTSARPIVVLVRAACAFELLLGGFARIYVGAHWPSDVIGSVLLAMLYLGLAWRVDRHVRHIREAMGATVFLRRRRRGLMRPRRGCRGPWH